MPVRPLLPSFYRSMAYIAKKAPWEKWIGLIAILLGLLTVFAYNVRAAILIIPLAILLIIFLAKKYKLLVTAVIIFSFFYASIFFRQNLTHYHNQNISLYLI